MPKSGAFQVFVQRSTHSCTRVEFLRRCLFCHVFQIRGLRVGFMASGPGVTVL